MARWRQAAALCPLRGNGPAEFAARVGAGLRRVAAFSHGLSQSACPLASLDLLVSDASTDQFAPPGATSTTIQRARFADVEAAIRARFQRGNHADDRLLFFYCGHGVARGLNMTL